MILPPLVRRIPGFDTLMTWLGLVVILLTASGMAVWFAPQTIARTATAPDIDRFAPGLQSLETDAAVSFRWTDGAEPLSFAGLAPEWPTLISLKLNAYQASNTPQTKLRIVGRGAQPIFAIAPAWRTYHILLDTEHNAAGSPTAKLTCTITQIDSSGRTLCVAIAELRARQLGNFASAPITERSLFLSAAALLFALILWRFGLPIWVAHGAAVVVSGILCMAQLLAGSLFAYLIPNLWFVLGIVSIATLLPIGSLPRLGAVALILSLAGGIALWLRLPIVVGLALLLLGALGLLQQTTGIMTTTDDTQLSPQRMRYALLAATLVAVALRLVLLNELPVGLWRDEARHGLIALTIWRDPGYRPIYEPGADLPALLFYLIAPIVGTFGADLWTVRLVSTLAGACTPLAIWFALRPFFGDRVGIIAAWCMAASAWGLYMSRWAFPTILDPLLALIAIGAAIRAVHPNTAGVRAAGWMALAGVCAGLATYTYHTGRLTPAIVLLALIAALRSYRTIRQRWLALVIGLVACALVAAPLLWYAEINADYFNRRVDRVGLMPDALEHGQAPLAAIQTNLVRYVMMWHVAGDANARHYAPRRPVLDPIAGVALLIGIGVSLLRPYRTVHVWLLIWLAVGLAPGVMSGDAPHAMRSIGALAPAYALVAVGLDRLIRTWRYSARRPFQVLAAAMLGITIWNTALYFGTVADQQIMFPKTYTAETLLARAASHVPGRYRIYFSSAMARQDVTRFLTSGLAIGEFDGQRFSPALDGPALILLPDGADDTLGKQVLVALGPQGRLLATGPAIPNGTHPLYTIYGIGPDAAQVVNQLSLPR